MELQHQICKFDGNSLEKKSYQICIDEEDSKMSRNVRLY